MGGSLLRLAAGQKGEKGRKEEKKGRTEPGLACPSAGRGMQQGQAVLFRAAATLPGVPGC